MYLMIINNLILNTIHHFGKLFIVFNKDNLKKSLKRNHWLCYKIMLVYFECCLLIKFERIKKDSFAFSTFFLDWMSVFSCTEINLISVYWKWDIWLLFSKYLSSFYRKWEFGEKIKFKFNIHCSKFKKEKMSMFKMNSFTQMLRKVCSMEAKIQIKVVLNSNWMYASDSNWMNFDQIFMYEKWNYIVCFYWFFFTLFKEIKVGFNIYHMILSISVIVSIIRSHTQYV